MSGGMEWTPDLIRAKADAMERRLGQPLSGITPGTLRLVIEALRFFAAWAFMERHEGYTVEVVDHRRGTGGEWVGQVADIHAAELLYRWAIGRRPRIHATVRKGGWVVRHRRPGEPAAGPVTALLEAGEDDAVPSMPDLERYAVADDGDGTYAVIYAGTGRVVELAGALLRRLGLDEADAIAEHLEAIDRIAASRRAGPSD